MTQLSLTLDAPVSRSRTLDLAGDAKGFARNRAETYRAVSVTARDEKNPALRGRRALEIFSSSGRPQWIICHPLDAEAIGAEVDGVLVIATGKARNTYLLGPLEG